MESSVPVAIAPNGSTIGSATVEQSYKAREIEGSLDLLFFRPLGLRLARWFCSLGATPSQVTLLGTAIGIAGGHFYFYQSLAINAIGILFQITADLFDSVDGQLARLTKQQTVEGRVLDGVGSYLVYLSIYVHLSLRYVADGGSSAIWLLAIATSASHSLQSGMIEFCRDAYAHFASRRLRAMDNSAALREARDHCNWKEHPVRKLLLILHVAYVEQQERMLPALARLRDRAAAKFGQNVPDEFAALYANANRGIITAGGFLGDNYHSFLLYALILLRHPIWFLVAEVTIFNAVLVWLLVKQNRASSAMLPMVAQWT
jgi:phosphatidylglycerophosphate synthase